MTWRENGSSQTQYRIERSVVGGPWSAAGTAGYYGRTTFRDFGLISDQQVCYRIIAYNLGGEAPPSEPDCTAPPKAPSNLVGTLREDGAVELTWSDNSAVEDGYEVFAWITQYNHDCDAGCFDYTYEASIAGVSANETSFVCSVCAGWPTFVRATKDGGYSDMSNEVTVPSGQ